MLMSMFHLPPNPPHIYLWKRPTPFPLSHVSNNLEAMSNLCTLDQKLSLAKQTNLAVLHVMGAGEKEECAAVLIVCVFVCTCVCTCICMYLCVRVCIARGLSQAHGNKP